MSRYEPPRSAESRTGESKERVTPEEIRRLIEDDDARPEEVTAIVKRLVLETIEEVRREIGGGDPGAQ